MGGFALIVLFALQYGKRMIDRTMGVCLTIFFTTQIFTIILDSGTTTIGNLITIIFMFIEIIVFLVMLNNEEIYLLELERFCKYILVTGIIMSVYNVFFMQIVSLLYSKWGQHMEWNVRVFCIVIMNLEFI